MAAGSFTLTRRNNKSDYVILRTMQRATVRYENMDCLFLTCDTALLLFDMNISTTFAACYYLVWKYRLTIQHTMQRATVRYENMDCLCLTYDTALLLFDMNISTTSAACYYLVWKYRLTVSYIGCSPATVRYENMDCLCRTCDTALLLFDMNISSTFAACYYLVWKYRLTVSYIRCSLATVRHEDINYVRSPRKMRRATVWYPVRYQRAYSSIPVSWHLEGIYGKLAGETSEYCLCPSRFLRFCPICNPASFKIREMDCTMQCATVRYENIDCL